MSFQKIVLGVSCLLLLCSGALANVLPVNDQSVFDSPTESAQAAEISRDHNPNFNVWEYAKIHDGSVNIRAAEAEPAQQDAPTQGNQCMWAIISCCDAQTSYERNNCFEALGCPGAWFGNICSQEYLDIANGQLVSIFGGGFRKK